MEINTSKSKRYSTKVDLTAMVDLGFLLITFFMLATSFATPKIMKVVKPDPGDDFDYPESKTATILIGPGDIAYCYSLPDQLLSLKDLTYDSILIGSLELRKYIQRRQDEVKSKWGDADQLFLIIKPIGESSLQHLVDVLDEIAITDVAHYAIVNEKTLVDSLIGEKWFRGIQE